MMHTLTLALGLGGLWALLSGHTEPLLVGFGIASVGFVTLLAWRMDVVDREAVPLTMLSAVWTFWPWLGREIAKSSIDVARLVWAPRLRLSPQVFRVQPSQRGDLGRVTFANAITLTPGTVTIEMDDDGFVIHSLTRDMKAGLLNGEMDRRVHAQET